MIRSDHDYHSARSRQELEQARTAASDCARRAHLQLARLHAVYQSGQGDEAAPAGSRQGHLTL